MEALTFTVPVEPVGKGRPRVLRSGRAYTPATTRAFEAAVADAAIEAARGAGWAGEGPYGLAVMAIKARPQRMCRRVDPDGLRLRCAKPDGDNVLKAVADAIVSAGLVADDALIAEWRVTSLWAEKGEAGRVVVSLAVLDVDAMEVCVRFRFAAAVMAELAENRDPMRVPALRTLGRLATTLANGLDVRRAEECSGDCESCTELESRCGHRR